MPADDFQIGIWLDTVDVYRDSPTNRDTSGNPLGATKVISALVGKLYSTPNFDQIGPVTQLKEQNIVTSDMYTCDTSTDIRMGDYFHILGGFMIGQWRKVAAISNTRLAMANYTEVYLSLCVPPKL